MEDTKIVQIHKISPNFKIRLYFRFMGFGRFSECGLVYCLLWLRKDIIYITYINIHITITCKLTTSVCAIRVYRVRVVIIISLPVPCICLLCQHARSVPACQRVILEVSELPWMFSKSPRCPEGQVVVPLCQMAQNPQDCTYGSNWFVMMILCVFLSHVMAYWLCLSPLIVSLSLLIVKTWFSYGRQYVKSLYGVFIIVHSWIIQYLDKWNRFYMLYQFCLVFLTNNWLIVFNRFSNRAC